jgi:hypothetical protein
LNESYLDVYAIDSSSGKKFMHITVTPEGIEQGMLVFSIIERELKKCFV